MGPEQEGQRRTRGGLVREVSPRSPAEWSDTYAMRLAAMLREKGINLSAEEYLRGLGVKLHMKITEVLQTEIDDVLEEDCIAYIKALVIGRTFEGYQTEIKTIHGALTAQLGVRIEPAPDEWDRLCNVDFFIGVGSSAIGLQIKPVTYEQTPQVHNWRQWLEKSHDKFRRDHGGAVFIVFSTKDGTARKIVNTEVVEEIRREISRLGQA